MSRFECLDECGGGRVGQARPVLGALAHIQEEMDDLIGNVQKSVEYDVYGPSGGLGGTLEASRSVRSPRGSLISST